MAQQLPKGTVHTTGSNDLNKELHLPHPLSLRDDGCGALLGGRLQDLYIIFCCRRPHPVCVCVHTTRIGLRPCSGRRESTYFRLWTLERTATQIWTLAWTATDKRLRCRRCWDGRCRTKGSSQAYALQGARPRGAQHGQQNNDAGLAALQKKQPAGVRGERQGFSNRG